MVTGGLVAARVNIPTAVGAGVLVDNTVGALVGDVVDSGVGMVENASNSIVEAFVGIVESLTPENQRK